MAEKRKLAAIMFTDLVGYTSIMSRDEQKALKILKLNREIQKSLIKEFNGDWLKEMGDGTLSCFQSALDAINCARAILKKIKNLPEIKLRIGIHLGDIIFSEGDIYGDGVNIASRLEPLANPSSICISEHIYEMVHNITDVKPIYIGEKHLKNVSRPLKVYLLAEEETPFDKEVIPFPYGIKSGDHISKYKIIEKIGEGGMGIVYKAEDIKLKRLVALKFLQKNLSIDKNNLNRFEIEAQATAAINHPNITTIYEIGEHMGVIFIAMEYAGDQSLRDKIKNNSPFDLLEAINIFKQILSGTEAAHKKEIIHRDLKPENILINDSGNAKVSDFGLAKFTHRPKLTLKGIAVGTIAYSSPEQLLGKEMDKRTDIWSLGIIFFEMLTGKTPFQAEYEDSLKYSIVNEPLPEISNIRKDIPKSISVIFSRMLNKDVEERYSLVSDIINDIKNVEYDIINKTKKIEIEREKFISKAVLTKTFASILILSLLIIAYIFFIGRESEAKILPSIGVLYLKNLGTEDDEYFSYGITEDIIIDLSKAGLIRVPSMIDILSFNESVKPLNKIAEDLNVRFILTGSIHKTADKLKIRVQLIEPENEKNLWAERWDEPEAKVIDIKQSIVDEIIRIINSETGSNIGIKQSNKYIPDPAAYQYYLKGVYLYDHMKTSNELVMARDFFKNAIGIDSNFTTPLIKLGLTYYVEGDYNKAESYYQKALDKSINNGNSIEESEALSSIGTIQRLQGNMDEALKNFTKAYNIAIEINDKKGECLSLRDIGIIFDERGKYDNALENFNKALTISLQLEDKKLESMNLNSIAIVYYHKGDKEKTLEYLEKTLEIRRELGNEYSTATILINLAVLYSNWGDFNSAIDYNLEAYNILENIGDKANLSYALSGLGNVYFEIGDFEKSLEYLLQTLDLARELGDKSQEAYTLHNIGNLNFESGNYESALQNYSKALEIFYSLGDKWMEANLRTAVGIAYFTKNNFIIAEREFNDAIEVFTNLGSQVDLMKPLSYLTLCKLYSGKNEDGKENLDVLEEKISNIEEKDINYVILWNISLAYEKLGETNSSKAYLNDAYYKLIDNANQIKNEQNRNSFLNTFKLKKEIANRWREKSREMQN